MCGPAALLAASVAISSATAIAQHQEGKAVAKDANARAEENAASARQNAINGYASLQLRQRQEREATAQQLDQNAMERREAEGQVKAASASSGTTGLSIDALLRDYAGVAANNDSTIRTNQAWADTQTLAELESIRAFGQSQVNSMPKVRGPSAFGPALSIAGSAMSSYARYNPAAFEKKQPAEKPKTPGADYGLYN